MARAQVRLLWAIEEQGIASRSRRRTVTDGGGYFLFTSLGPGSHTLSVTAGGYRGARRETMPDGEILIELQETAS